VTERDSCSDSSTLTGSPLLSDDSMDMPPSKVIAIMSFDTFTEFHCHQDDYMPAPSFSASRGAVAYPVPEKVRTGVNIWSNTNNIETFPKTHVLPQKRQLACSYLDSAFDSPSRTADVGLDLDNMMYNCEPQAMKVSPDPYARLTPPPAPMYELPEKKDWGLRCTIPVYQYAPQSPSAVVPSGAAVVTPCHAPNAAPHVSAFVPAPSSSQQYSQQCSQQCCDPADIEAAEWRDVLDYFCGPQALYC
jgi:hypothetical protein